MLFSPVQPILEIENLDSKIFVLRSKIGRVSLDLSAYLEALYVSQILFFNVFALVKARYIKCHLEISNL